MFDLIDECGKELAGNNYTIRSDFRYHISRAKLTIHSSQQEKDFSICKGVHYIFNAPLLHLAGQECENYLAHQLSLCLRKMLKEKGWKSEQRVLLACLGNPDIQADMLGKIVFDKTNNFCLQKAGIFKLCPNISLFTGIQSGDLIKMVVEREKISLVVLIDSLTTSSLDRLGKTIQLVSGGMTPGSGVNRFGVPIDEKFLKAKCISIGTPFMISSCNFAPEKEEFFLCPKDVAKDIDRVAGVIASALERVLL